MTYICLCANEKAAALAGDSRVLLRFGIHHPFRQKVFLSHKPALAWACSGMVRWHWHDYAWHVGHILRGKNSMPQKLQRIGEVVTPMTLKRYQKTGQTTIFHLLIAEATAQGIEVYDVKASNGMFTISLLNPPVFLHAGYYTSRFTKPSKERFAEASPKALEALVREKTKEAIAIDQACKQEDKNFLRTIGGFVRSVCLLSQEKSGKP